MTKEISSRYIKLSGKAEIDRDLETSHNYHISLQGSITSITDTDNQDGTLHRAFKFEPVKVELLNELGEIIKAKDTRKEAQKTRAWAYKYWEEAQLGDMDFDTFYHKFQVLCRTNMEEIVKNIK
jgi:hypothetical protein